MKRLFIIMGIIAAAALSGCAAVRTDSPAGSAAAGVTGNYSALDGTGSGWGFVRKKGEAPDIPSAQSGMLEKYNGRYIDHSKEKNLYLTFDEGYENGFTARILDILAKTNTPAAFFVTGPYLEGQGELIKRMIDEGHIVGNHTVHHLNLPKQTVETVQKDISALNEKCEELYGYKMEYMRPPEGEFSERSLAVINDMGMKTIMWSFAYKDWDVNVQQGADYAYESVMPYLHDGAIILLHAVSSDNTDALERIINDAKAQGYTFKALDELYDSVPDSAPDDTAAETACTDG